MMTASAQTQTVKGLVIDETGTPIVGATVVVKDRPTIGTSTSVKGEFELSGVPQTGKLQISYVGYKTQDVDVAANIRVQLEPDAQNVEAVVVTGMTQMDKRLFTGAADQLVADDVKLAGMADISRGLEGRSAGVSVQNVSGTFGTAPKIRVRGATSIYGSSKPLWVVDGVIMEDIVDIDADALSSGRHDADRFGHCRTQRGRHRKFQHPQGRIGNLDIRSTSHGRCDRHHDQAGPCRRELHQLYG